MNKESIEGIWLGRPIKSYVSDDDATLIAEKLNELREIYSILSGSVDASARKHLEEYLRCQSEIADIEKKGAFIDGFSLGVRLVIEGLNE